MARRERRDKKDELPDLVPIMNLVTILIPFLLMAAQFVHLSVIDSTLPAIGEPDPTPPDEEDKPPLVLTVAITDKGFTVTGADAILNPEGAEGAAAPIEGEESAPTIPCMSGGSCSGVDDYDYKELTETLSLIKDEYPDDENVILLPESRVEYEILVRVMDASREDPETKNPDGSIRELFPFVVIAGGAI